jgi:hypothetical protein
LRFTSFLDNRWIEPVPFEIASPYGLAFAGNRECAWLSSPSGVWRAIMQVENFDLSEALLSVKADLREDGGKVVIELLDEGSQRFSPYRQEFAAADTGFQIDLYPGYWDSAGIEISTGLTFSLQAYEHNRSPGRSSLTLYAEDGWIALDNWSARHQFRWNKPDQYGQPTMEASVKEILSQVLARCGLRLEVISESPTIAGFYPDFTIHPGENGKTTVRALLSFIPDVIFIEGDQAYLLDPHADDGPVYRYASQGSNFQPILEGRYRTSSRQTNRVKVQGSGVLVESFDWADIQRSGDILDSVEDSNILNSDMARARAEAVFRKAEIETVSALIRVPVNCGQQLYDVISITDPVLGLSEVRRRILGISFSFVPSKAEYEQKLILGGV